MAQWTLLEWLVAAGAVAAIVMLVVAMLAWLFPRQKSTILHWKGWPIVRDWYRYYRRRFRMHRAKNIMRSKLEGSLLTIPARIYADCLAENRRTSKRDLLGNIIPEKPAWLNDYYVASALESLSSECKIVKATKFELNGFPPRSGSYQFSAVKEGTTAKQQVNEIETDSQCLVHQIFQECLEAPRYQSVTQSETVAPGRVNHAPAFLLREDAPPCNRCWEIKQRQSNIRLLVDDITRYDLASKATPNIKGMNREFQEAVIATCIESKCAAEVATVKKVIEQAIEIRGIQLDELPVGRKMDWNDQLTTEFTSRLRAYIESEVEQTRTVSASTPPPTPAC